MNLHDISAHDYLANLHELEHDNYDDNNDHTNDNDVFHDTQQDDNDDQQDRILAHVTQREQLPPSDIKRILSPSMTRPDSKSSTSSNSNNKNNEAGTNNNKNTSQANAVIRQANRTVTYQASMHNITYSVSKHEHKPMNYGGLVDRGANGIVAGNDVRVIAKSHRRVNVQGIDNHQVTDIPIGSVGARLNTQHGPVIGIFHQAAIHGQGRTIVSCGQLEHHGVTIDDKSKHVGGKQCMRTLEGYVMPFNFFSGLAYLRMQPYTDTEWDTLPHVILTSDQDWDPTVLDHIMDDDDKWFDTLDEPLTMPGDNNFDEYGNYRHRHIAASTITTRVHQHKVRTILDDDPDDDYLHPDEYDDDIHPDDDDDDDEVFLDSVDYAVYYHQQQACSTFSTHT